MKPGSRLKSAACSSEAVLIKHSAGTIECGGAPMSADASGDGTPAPGFDGGTVMGKRYVDEAGTIELLCVKPGKGSFALDGVALVLKEAKPLPASD
ncbi:hypothetical protein B0I00_1977 [Novosphingobium kunmingense]|uniref:Uncharacterized protein n=1 Tax=Novosphingobium kunmingense TaxID=1211806 RepID=A0A2N0H647_9SPHN|nr:hypothetical protein [Novosphingobium kunmingense]PKB14390.1 hypothetical protein B0I00_1977 [Novosphingobium kunmingense]